MNLDKAEKLPVSVLTDITTDTDNVIHHTPDENVGGNITPVINLEDTKSHIKEGMNNPFYSSPNQPNDPNKPNNPALPITTPIKLGDTIGGKRAVDLFDAIFPSLIVLGALYGLNMKINKKGLQLDADEKKLLAPFFQDYLNSLNINMNNPLNNLLLAAGLIYGAKIIDLAPTVEKAKVIPMNNQPPAPNPNPNENLVNFKREVEDAIKQSIKSRKQSRTKVIDHLNRDGTFLKLKVKYGIHQNVKVEN